MSALLDTTAAAALRLVATTQAEGRLPSVAAGVVRDGELVWSAGRGRHVRRDNDARPDSDTQYKIGSVTKTMTAALVMLARERGQLELGDTVGRFRPDGPYAAATIRSLLSHSAGLTGQPTTPAIDNLVLAVDGATGSVEDLVADLDDGLLLTCLWYIREVDPQTMLLTGLTRDGVYRVRGGEIVGAVNNFRFNESPLDLLRRFTAASATVPSFSREWGDDYFSRTATPALRVPDFNMSSVSQAL